MYTIVSAFAFLFLFIIWSNSDWKNIGYKFVYACLALWGFWIILGSPSIKGHV